MPSLLSRLVAAVFVLALALSSSRPAWAQSDLETVKSRMLDDAVAHAGFKAQTDGYYGTDFTQASAYLSQMTANGSWSDVAYGDTSNTWPALKHLDRLLVLAYVYNQESEALYHSAALLSALNKGLGYWYQVNPKSKNWFKNDIAKQFYLGPLGLMMQGRIDAGYLGKIIADLSDAPRMTGANKTALSTSVIYRAVLEGNSSRLASGVNGVVSVIAVTSGDGIQRDRSFQQHGGILYNGNYGFGFLRDVTWVATMVRGTSYAFGADQIGLLRDNFLDGTRWMIRGRLLDYNVRGREVGSGGGANLRADDFLPILERFAVIDPAQKAAYDASALAISNETAQQVRGARHYWNSDYTAVQRDSYFASVKMCSKRTIGMERDVNTENLLGYWLPYGLTYTIQHGDEYDYIFPIWDWARLPGVTAPHVEISASDNTAAYTSQDTSFVGGAHDDQYAVSAMDFSIEQTRAKKSWFWFEHEWVALGAGIESSHSAPVFTSIEQVLEKGAVVSDGLEVSGGPRTLTNPDWVLHAGVGYVFPVEQTVQVQAVTQTGSVKRIFGLGSAAALSGEVFSLWIDHGKSPDGASYQYVVVPGVEQTLLERYSADVRVGVLSNTASLQAVTHRKERVSGAVFFQAGSVSVPEGPTITVDKPCVVVLNEPAGSVAVSDPTGSLSVVKVSVTNVSGTKHDQQVALPSGDNHGKSVLVTTLLEPRPAIEDGFWDEAELPGASGGASSTGGVGPSGAGGSSGEGGGVGLPGSGGSLAESDDSGAAQGCGCSVPGTGPGRTRAAWWLLGGSIAAFLRFRRYFGHSRRCPSSI